MLASLAGQTALPDQLVVVDGSASPIEDIVKAFPRLPLEYVRCVPPSLARQRNAGMARLASGITLAGYLDDDLVLERDAIQSMRQFWESAQADIGGAAFNIRNNPRPGGLRLKRLFGIDSARPGMVLPSGCASTIPSQSGDIETEWLYGGATVWRRDVVRDFGYDEWFVGTGFMEDIDYSFSVRSRYRLAIVSRAQVTHYSRPVRPDRQSLLGTWQVVNRMYFVRKYTSRGMSRARAWWATLGLILLNTGAAIVRRDLQYWNRARGNIAGVFSLMRRRHAQIGGYLK